MRVASDIGGTFTDLVYLDEESGRVGTAKVDTTPPDFERAVIDSIRKAELEPATIRFFVHGTTAIINALTERKGAKTALITTKGFRDVLEITRANRPDLYNLYYTKPKPFVPRYLRKEVTERVNYKGEVLTPLNEDEVRQVVEELRREEVEAIAICLIHAYANPDHEMRCGELVWELWPEVSVTLSHEVTKEWREYERTSTAVLNSYVKPTAERYIDLLEKKLRQDDIPANLYIMKSNGGTATFTSGKACPITIVESGPVAGVLGAQALGELLGENNLISFDMGGTTAKCSLIEGGQVKVTTDYHIERTRTAPGYPVKVPVVDIIEIGAGGGSVAWLDDVGALHVGPQSAGAQPGPACYGRGGEDPTVTDANLLVGRINPGYFLGGEIQLDAKRARRAMAKVSQPLGIDQEEASLGVIRLANANMVNALKLISLYRGYDPRDFTLVAFGGAGAMHAAELALELGVKRILVPRNPGVFSAWGMLCTDLRYDIVQTRIGRMDQMDSSALDALWGPLEGEIAQHLQNEGLSAERVRIQRYADMRYAGQEHTVKVPVPGGPMSAENLSQVAERFHALHEQYYTFRLGSPIEFVNFHVSGFGSVEKVKMPKFNGSGSFEEALKGHREVHWDEKGKRRTPIYERDHLGVGTRVEGPAIVEEADSTTVVFPDQVLTVDEYGNLSIERGA